MAEIVFHHASPTRPCATSTSHRRLNPLAAMYFVVATVCRTSGEAVPNYPIDPFAGDLKTNLDQLMDVQWNTRQAVISLSSYQQPGKVDEGERDEPDIKVRPVRRGGKFWRLSHRARPVGEVDLDPPAKRAEIGRKAWEMAKPYTLPENERSPKIIKAAEAVGHSTASFEKDCDKMADDNATIGFLVRQRIESYMIRTMVQNLEQLGSGLKAAAGQSDVLAMSAAMSATWADAAEGFDTKSKKFLGGIVLEIQLIGSLIDVGNAFVNLNETRNIAMLHYVTGKEPKGWKNRLPRPLASVFSEATWVGLEKGVEVLLEQGLPSVIPFGSAITGLAKAAFEIRNQGRHRRLKFRRNDVDDLLNLEDQLTKATSVAQGHLAIVDGVRNQVVIQSP